MASKESKDRKIYGNCRVLSPDGILMFLCEEKRINWYIERKLADKINDNPITIKFNFKPNGLGNNDKPYGLIEMSNKCVICGSEEFLTRHHVVPICYRRYFPLKYKSKNHHDVLAVCFDCHEKYEVKAFELKRRLAEEYNAPLDGILDKSMEGKGAKIIGYSRLLLSDNSKFVPKNRLEEIRSVMFDHFGREYTEKDLIETSLLKTTMCKKTHGEIVVSKLDSIQEFIEMWRTHFVESNDCKCLPDKWRVNNVIERD